jgi:plasmid maintenance system antidote protein VapI
MKARILICGAAAAAIGAAVGGLTVANASGSSGTPGTPAKAAVSSTSLDPAVAHAAAQLGVSPQQLMHALATVKRRAASHPISDSHVATALAERLHVTPARAQRALNDLFGAADSMAGESPAVATPPDWAISALAEQLHVTRQRARWVVTELDRMTGRDGGIEPGSTAFARLSRALDMTPAYLAKALARWKESLAASAPSASPSPTQSGGASPTK